MTSSCLGLTFPVHASAERMLWHVIVPLHERAMYRYAQILIL
jgi:hypothetical protein